MFCKRMDDRGQSWIETSESGLERKRRKRRREEGTAGEGYKGREWRSGD